MQSPTLYGKIKLNEQNKQALHNEEKKLNSYKPLSMKEMKG